MTHVSDWIYEMHVFLSSVIPVNSKTIKELKVCCIILLLSKLKSGFNQRGVVHVHEDEQVCEESGKKRCKI